MLESEYHQSTTFSFSDAGMAFRGGDTIHFWDKQTVQVIARSGQVLDLYPGCTIRLSDDPYLSKLSMPKINNAGDIVFGANFYKADSSGTTVCPGSALVHWNKGKWSIVADSLQAVPSMPGYSFRFYSGIQFSLDESGAVVFLSDANTVGFYVPSYWYKTPTQPPQLIAFDGETVAPDYVNTLDVGVIGRFWVSANSNGQLIADATPYGGSYTLFTGQARTSVPYTDPKTVSANQLIPIASVGQQPLGMSATSYFSKINAAWLDAQGDMVISAEVSDALDKSVRKQLWHADQTKITGYFFALGQSFLIKGKTYQLQGFDLVGVGNGQAIIRGTFGTEVSSSILLIDY
jgi:hypothetical protein